MTFDTVMFQPSPSENTLLQDVSHAETRNGKSITKKDTNDEFCEDTQFADWENEGGTYSDSTCSVSWSDSLNKKSYISEHIDNATTFMASGEYQAAYDELEAAAERFLGYQTQIKSSFERSISHLSTMGCHASPPHAISLPLINLRRKLEA